MIGERVAEFVAAQTPPNAPRDAAPATRTAQA
jgi:hypothetical protein